MEKKLLLLGLLSLALVGCDQLKTGEPTGRPPTPDAMNLAQAKAAEAQANLQIENQKRLTAIQLSVADTCVKKGWVPVFINGNVDCKKGEK